MHYRLAAELFSLHTTCFAVSLLLMRTHEHTHTHKIPHFQTQTRRHSASSPHLIACWGQQFFASSLPRRILISAFPNRMWLLVFARDSLLFTRDEGILWMFQRYRLNEEHLSSLSQEDASQLFQLYEEYPGYLILCGLKSWSAYLLKLTVFCKTTFIFLFLLSSISLSGNNFISLS